MMKTQISIKLAFAALSGFPSPNDREKRKCHTKFCKIWEENGCLNAQKRLILEIKQVGFFSIICDKGNDISKLDHFSFSVRFVNEDLSVEQCFLGVLECEEGIDTFIFLPFCTKLG